MPVKIKNILTPQKPNTSILKCTTNQSSTLLNTTGNTQLTPGKSVKFNFITENAPEDSFKKHQQAIEFHEPFEIVNLRDRALELHKSPSAGSLDSAMSTISSRSALNLPARLADLENDEKIMEMETATQNNEKNYQMFSNDSSNSSLLNDEDDEDKEHHVTLTEKTDDALFKQPVDVTENRNSTIGFLKINSGDSFANSTVSSKTGTGLAERLNDFETQTIEENFNGDILIVFMETIQQRQDDINNSTIHTVNSMTSVKSTMSSQSAKNLQERLEDFENESISDYKISGNDVTSESNNLIADNEQNTTIQDFEREFEISEVTPISTLNPNYVAVEESSKIDFSQSMSTQTLITPIPANLAITSSQTSTIVNQDREMDDEIIFSISDNDQDNNEIQSSFTSISSKCTTATDFSIQDYGDVTVSKRKYQPRRTKVAALAAEYEARQSTDGPLTRSKLKGISNRSSIDGLASSSQEPSLHPTPVKRGTRNTRSMTRSPSPTNSLLSTASTTVARNASNLKRRASNPIKKPSKVLEEHNIVEEEKEETTKRYNLRSRRASIQTKDNVLDTLVETAANLAPKKVRKTVKRKNSLYKIDEAADNLIRQSKAESLKEIDNEFQFSNPRNANIDKTTNKYCSDNSDSETNDKKAGKSDSSFTFSPPHSSRKK